MSDGVDREHWERWLEVGDRVIYTPEGWAGVVDELAAEGMAHVRFDSGTTGRVFTSNLAPEVTE